MVTRSRLLLLLLAYLAMSGMGVAQQPNVPAGSRFVMAHFKSDGGGGDERLFISVSPDGLQWTALNGGNPVWEPQGAQIFMNVVRDPSIVYDNGFYWVGYTSGNYGNHESFGLVKSQDLLNWTFVGEIDVHLPDAPDQLTWNPVFFRDGDGSVHAFVNISPTGGSTYNPGYTMRTYETHPLNAEWTEWSDPVLVDLPHSNTNEFFVWKEGATYHGVYVDMLRWPLLVKVSSNHLITGWGNMVELNTGGEGVMILKHPDGSGYRLYTEPGNGSGGPITTYRTAELSPAFSPVSSLQPVQSSIGIRNGKMTLLAGTTTYSQWQSQHLAGRPVSDQSPLADPDKDGLPNILEALGALDPLSWQGARHPAPKLTAGLTYRRAPWLAATLSPEVSGDLNTWTTNGVVTDSVTMLSDGTEEVHVHDSTTDSTARFMRLRAALPITVEPTTATATSISTPVSRQISSDSTPLRIKRRMKLSAPRYRFQR